MISVFNSCIHFCDLFKLTEIFEIVLLYLTISIVICPKFLYPFLWSLHSHRNFFENLSSNLATITRNLSVISSTLQKSFKIIFMNWNNSCESCYTKNWIFYLLNLQTGAIFGAKKRQNVQEILYLESYLWLSSSASHTPYLNNPFLFPQQTIKIPWNCKIIHFSTEASRLSTTRQDNIFPQYINELFSNNFFILSFPSGGHFSKKDQGESTYKVKNWRMPGTK